MDAAQPCGMTPIGTALQRKLLNPFVALAQQSAHNRTAMKPLLVLTVTDGEPQGEPRDTLCNAIVNTRRQLVSMGMAYPSDLRWGRGNCGGFRTWDPKPTPPQVFEGGHPVVCDDGGPPG